MNYKVTIQTQVTIWHDDPDSQDAKNEAWFRIFDDWNSSNYPDETVFKFEPLDEDE